MQYGRIANKKHVLFVVLISVVAVFLCGCVMVRADLDIHSDGSAGVEVVYALDQTYLPMVQEQIGTDPFSALKTEMADRGLTVVDYKNGQYTGVTGKIELDDAGKVAKLGKSMSLFSDLDIKVNKSSGKIDVAGQVDLKKVAQQMGASTLADTATALQAGDTTLSITFPFPVTNHNADKTENGSKTLIWQLKTDAVNEIFASTQPAEVSLGSLPWITIGIAAVLAVIVVVLLVVTSKKRRNTDYI